MHILWQTSTPTKPGVYPASSERNPEARRRFNGRRWSAPWYVGDPDAVVQRAQRTPARLEAGLSVEWIRDAQA